MKNKKPKEPSIKSFREFYSRIAARLGCSMTVAVFLCAICFFIISLATTYLFYGLWPGGEPTNPLRSAAFFAVFMTAFFFVSDYFSLIERMDRWSWKSKKKREEER